MKSYQQASRDKLSRDLLNFYKQKYFRSLNEFNCLKRKKERFHWYIKKNHQGNKNKKLQKVLEQTKTEKQMIIFQF